MKIYCVRVERELDNDYIFHFKWDKEIDPTREYIQQLVYDENINFKLGYDEFQYWEINVKSK